MNHIILVTYKLAQAVAEVANISLGSVLKSFGEYWVLKQVLKNMVL